MSTRSPLNPDTSDRDRRVQQIVQEVARRREGGEDLPAEKVIQDHSNLLPELGAQLRGLRPVGSRGDQDETIVDISSKGRATKSRLPGRVAITLKPYKTRSRLCPVVFRA